MGQERILGINPKTLEPRMQKLRIHPVRDQRSAAARQCRWLSLTGQAKCLIYQETPDISKVAPFTASSTLSKTSPKFQCVQGIREPFLSTQALAQLMLLNSKQYKFTKEGGKVMSMETILIIIVLILIFGGGGFYWRGRR